MSINSKDVTMTLRKDLIKSVEDQIDSFLRNEPKLNHLIADYKIKIVVPRSAPLVKREIEKIEKDYLDVDWICKLQEYYPEALDQVYHCFLIAISKNAN